MGLGGIALPKAHAVVVRPAEPQRRHAKHCLLESLQARPRVEAGASLLWRIENLRAQPPVRLEEVDGQLSAMGREQCLRERVGLILQIVAQLARGRSERSHMRLPEANQLVGVEPIVRERRRICRLR